MYNRIPPRANKQDPRKAWRMCIRSVGCKRAGTPYTCSCAVWKRAVALRGHILYIHSTRSLRTEYTGVCQVLRRIAMGREEGTLEYLVST